MLEIPKAVKKHGVPSIIEGATPVGLHHHKALGVMPPFFSALMYSLSYCSAVSGWIYPWSVYKEKVFHVCNIPEARSGCEKLRHIREHCYVVVTRTRASASEDTACRSQIVNVPVDDCWIQPLCNLSHRQTDRHSSTLRLHHIICNVIVDPVDDVSLGCNNCDVLLAELSLGIAAGFGNDAPENGANAVFTDMLDVIWQPV